MAARGEAYVKARAVTPGAPPLVIIAADLFCICVVCFGPAVGTLAFLAGPLEEKRGQSEEEWEEVRQWSHQALGRAYPDPVKALV